MVFSRMLALGLLGWGLGADPGGGIGAVPSGAGPSESVPGETAVSETSALDALLERLRAQYPDRESVTEQSQQIADQLLEFSRLSRVDPDGPPVAGRAAILAAEILFQGGRTRAARDVLAEIARFGPRDEDRAKALYLLGEHYFFLDRYAETGPDGKPVSGTALYYWEILRERYPESPWSERVARPLRYVRLFGSREVPDFRETFDTPQGKVEYSRDGLRGKLVVLDFWRSSAPGQAESETALMADLARAFEESPALRGTVVVLGVNLDREREAYEAFRLRWQLLWPQVHDGEGFESPLASVFAIPRVPHRALIDPEGRLAYLGSQDPAFRAAFAAEVVKLRGEAERPGAAPADDPASIQESESDDPGSDSPPGGDDASDGSSGGA